VPRSRYEDTSIQVYVVKEAPFDLLIGSKRFAQDIRMPALILASRRKTKGMISNTLGYFLFGFADKFAVETQAEHANRERQETEARDLEIQQLKERIKARETQRQRNAVPVTAVQTRSSPNESATTS
jgi:hypothetical protein